MKRLATAGLVLATLLFLSWLMFFHHTEAYQLGVRWNLATGEISKDEAAGFHLTPPWVFVARIDKRPMRVCITSAGRGFNCRLIKFVPEQYKTFVETEGFRYWWWANRISFNFGHPEEYRGLRNLLRGYAYGAKEYPFVVTITEYHEGE